MNQFTVAAEHVFRVALSPEEREQLRSPADAIESVSNPGEYCLGPIDLDELECPLLLHPYVDQDATIDLDFTMKGQVRTRTTKGEWSITVFELGREQLNTLRSAIAAQLRWALIGRYTEKVKFSRIDPRIALDQARSCWPPG